MTLGAKKAKTVVRNQPSCLLHRANPPSLDIPAAPRSTPCPHAERRHRGTQRNTQKQAAEEGTVHCRAQHLCLAAAKQSPCVPAAVGVRATEDGTEGRKERSATGPEHQAGGWALGQPRPIHWVILGAVSFAEELPVRAPREPDQPCSRAGC